MFLDGSQAPQFDGPFQIRICVCDIHADQKAIEIKQAIMNATSVQSSGMVSY